MTDAAFDDWVSRAREADILEEARARGAVLKRIGGEFVGPCPACGGTDRFAISVKKRVFVCRGDAGGDVIALARHLDGTDFIAACEALTGEPPPGRRRDGHDNHPPDRAAQERRRAEAMAKAEHQAETEAERAEQRRQTAGRIWYGAKPIAGTLAEAYLVKRGIPAPPQGWPDCLRFHPSITHDLDRERPAGPALIARVDGPQGRPCGVWRIYLAPEATKIAGNAKLGLGAVAGGAVRLGGAGEHIGGAEGIETALAAWTLERYRLPVWAMLSTSGISGFVPPEGLKRFTGFPDGDIPKRKKDDSLSPPRGMAAMRKLIARLSGDHGIQADMV